MALSVGSSERENDFIVYLCSFVEEDPTKLIERGELYSLAKAKGFGEREVYSYAMDLDLLGYVKTQPILGGKIASLKLTAKGVAYAQELRERQKPL